MWSADAVLTAHLLLYIPDILRLDHLEVKMELEFFECEENGLYSRSSDGFSEKAYSEEDIEALLKECGFEVLAKYGDDAPEPPCETSQRIVYAARCIRSGQKY